MELKDLKVSQFESPRGGDYFCDFAYLTVHRFYEFLL